MISVDYVKKGRIRTVWFDGLSDALRVLHDWNDPNISIENVVPDSPLPKGFITRLSASRVEYYHRPGEGRDDPL